MSKCKRKKKPPLCLLSQVNVQEMNYSLKSWMWGMVHHIDNILNIFPIVRHCFDDIVPTYYFQNLEQLARKHHMIQVQKENHLRLCSIFLKKKLLFIYKIHNTNLVKIKSVSCF